VTFVGEGDQQGVSEGTTNSGPFDVHEVSVQRGFDLGSLGRGSPGAIQR
jgi:hypothetical protein